MTQVFLHGFDVVPCQQRSHRKAVPHIVESCVTCASSFSDSLEMLDDGSPNQVLPAGVCKDKVEGIASDLPCLLLSKTLLLLLGF